MGIRPRKWLAYVAAALDIMRHYGAAELHAHLFHGLGQLRHWVAWAARHSAALNLHHARSAHLTNDVVSAITLSDSRKNGQRKFGQPLRKNGQRKIGQPATGKNGNGKLGNLTPWPGWLYESYRPLHSTGVQMIA